MEGFSFAFLDLQNSKIGMFAMSPRLVILGAAPGSRVTHMKTLRDYYIYILANKRNGTLYVGVTNNLQRRMHEHKNNLVEGFTKTYNVHTLVYYEHTHDIHVALDREKELKRYTRKKKMRLIETSNPLWKDLLL